MECPNCGADLSGGNFTILKDAYLNLHCIGIEDGKPVFEPVGVNTYDHTEISCDTCSDMFELPSAIEERIVIDWAQRETLEIW